MYSIDHVPARLEKAKEIGAIPIDFSVSDPVAQIMKLEPVGVDRACDCVGFECVDASGKNVPNEVLTNAINVVKPGGGIGVIGAYIPNDPGETLLLFCETLFEVELKVLMSGQKALRLRLRRKEYWEFRLGHSS